MSGWYRSYSGNLMWMSLQLELQSLSSSRWCGTLCHIYKLLSTQCSKYLFDIIPSSETFYDNPKIQRFFFSCRTDCFKYSFFPIPLSECLQLAPEIKKLRSIAVFKNKIISFIRPSKRSIVKFNDPKGVKYLTRLSLPFSHLNEHMFRHGFLDTLKPLCNSILEVEDNEDFFLCCPNFENGPRFLFIDILNINSSFKSVSSHAKVELVLFGHSKLSTIISIITSFWRLFYIDNNLILKAIIKYIMTTNRFWYIILNRWYIFTLALYKNCFSSGFDPHSLIFSLFYMREQWDMCLCCILLSLFWWSL